MTISEIEQVFKDIFQQEEGRVKSVDTAYEKSLNDSYKLVIAIHGLSVEDTSIIHTKFIFKLDKTKTRLDGNYFTYLYDINCNYHKVEFSNIIELKDKIEKIIKSHDFGKDIQLLSDFIEAPATFLNHYLRQSKITEYSIFDVRYEPKFKMLPCDQVTFDFHINISNNYNISLTIKKIDKKDTEDINKYIIKLKLIDEIVTDESDTLMNIHSLIGANIGKLLEKKLR